MADLRRIKDRAADLAAKGRFDKAAELYRDAARADPRDVAAAHRLAEALRKAGREEESLSVYREVAGRYAREGLLAKAVAVCKVVLEIDPDHEETQRALAELYARRQSAPGRLPAAGGLPAAAPERRPPAAGGDEEPVVELPLEPGPRVIVPPPPADPAAEPPAPEEGETTAFEVILGAAEEARGSGVELDVLLDPDLLDEPPPAPAASAGSPAAALPRIPLFSDLSPAAFVALTGQVALRRVAAGEVVIREGEGGNAFYAVASGRFRVERRGEGGQTLLVGRLGEGSFFGEMALLSGAARAASVVAEEAGELLEIRPEVLAALCRTHPHVAESLTRFYRQRLLAMAMATSPLFRPFGKEERARIMERFRTREVTAGERVVAEGRPSDGLCVVLSGSFDVHRRQGPRRMLVGRLSEGDVFGEMSCLSKKPATATVTARRAGMVLRLPRAEFDELVVTYPQILELVSELSDERALSLEAIAAGSARFTDDGLVLV